MFNSDTTDNKNIVIGYSALFSTTTGSLNTAYGNQYFGSKSENRKKRIIKKLENLLLNINKKQ